jgi:actin-like ATPase involved in cell morphogenesis
VLSRICFFQKAHVEISISRTRITVHQKPSGKYFDQPPLVAISCDNRNPLVAAIGAEAAAYIHNPDYFVFNPFDHPRVAVSDHSLAVIVLRHAISSVHSKSYFSPTARLSYLSPLKGGLTEIEVKALVDIAVSAGCRSVDLQHKSTSYNAVITALCPT